MRDEMQVKDLVRVFVKGGIISPGDFLKIILVAEKLGATVIHFGSRQDILFAAKEKSKEILDKTFQSINTEYEINSFQYQNISSSYVALDILPSKNWLASHVYLNILKTFDFRARMRVNLVDPSQSLVPLFTGNINFIASNLENYWYVYLRFDRIRKVPWQMPFLVYSEELAKLVMTIEESPFLEEEWEYQQLYSYLSVHAKLNTQPVTEELVLPDVHFPYYEGINRLPDGKYWLGLYWRNNRFKTSILKAILERCIETEVGKVSLTPWKSFIIKGIFEKDHVGWEKLMGKFGMNLRHSALELNWHLPALDEDALNLKIFLVREMDQQDISTYGLTFTIKNQPDMTLFTSVVIERNLENKAEESYNILYSKDFNPNLTEYKVYARDVNKTVLAPLLLELSLIYYENLTDDLPKTTKSQAITDSLEKDLYQCKHCKTIYDDTFGDPAAGIGPGIRFDSLPEDYECPTCGNKKEAFRKLELA